MPLSNEAGAEWSLFRLCLSKEVDGVNVVKEVNGVHLARIDVEHEVVTSLQLLWISSLQGCLMCPPLF